MRQLMAVISLVLAAAMLRAPGAAADSLEAQFGAVHDLVLKNPLSDRMTRDSTLFHRTTHEDGPNDPLLVRQKPVLDLIEKVKGSVVVLRTEEPGQDSAPEGKKKAALCTGFFTDSSKYLDVPVVIVTNSHCVEMRKPGDATSVGLYDNSQNYPKVVPGKILAFGDSEAGKDIALVAVNDASLNRRGLPLWEKLDLGEEVVAIGNPRGLNFSVTKGIVSAIARDRLESQSVLDLTQTDVSVNPGNSGGPLFNLWGDVVGINNAIISRSGGFEGISLAVPAHYIVEAFKQYKRTGNLDVGYMQMSFGADEQGRLSVQGLTPDGPAAKAQLQQKDVILLAGGVDLSAMPYEDAARAFLTATKYKSPGETITLLIDRGGQRISATATLAGPPPKPAPERPEIVFPEPPAPTQPQAKPLKKKKSSETSI